MGPMKLMRGRSRSTWSQSGVHSNGSGSVTFLKIVVSFSLAVLGLGCSVGFSLAGESGDFSPAAVRGFLLALALLSRGMASGGPVLRELRPPGSAVWRRGSVALWRVGSPDQGWIPCFLH